MLTLPDAQKGKKSKNGKFPNVPKVMWTIASEFNCLPVALQQTEPLIRVSFGQANTDGSSAVWIQGTE